MNCDASLLWAPGKRKHHLNKANQTSGVYRGPIKMDFHAAEAARGSSRGRRTRRQLKLLDYWSDNSATSFRQGC